MRERLLEWVKAQHGNQVRKYTGEPYWKHVERVGLMADQVIPLGYEKGLCHDLIEDTDVTEALLYVTLLGFEYSPKAAKDISQTVKNVTDKYTPARYSTLNRKERKTLEAVRMWDIPADSQTLKYCDILDNTPSIVEHDPEFAVTYIQEKMFLLEGMDKGDGALFEQACLSIGCKPDYPQIGPFRKAGDPPGTKYQIVKERPNF